MIRNTTRLIFLTFLGIALWQTTAICQTTPYVTTYMTRNTGTPIEKYTISGVTSFKYGAGQQITKVGHWISGNNSDNGIQRETFWFPLSIPSNSELVEVTLFYTPINNSYTGDNSQVSILNQKDIGSFSASQWFEYVKNGESIIWENISNHLNSSIWSSTDHDPELFNRVSSALASPNKWISFGVSIMNDEAATHTYDYNLTLALTVRQKHYITIKNSTSTGTVYVDQGTGFQSFPSGTQLNLLLNQSIQIKADPTQQVNGVDWNFVHWSDSPTNIQTSNPYTLKVTKDAVWSATYEGPISIVFANKEGINNLSGSKLLLNNTDEINSGDSRSFLNNSQHSIKTLHETWDNKRIKQNNWNTISTDYKLQSQFTANDLLNSYFSQYLELKPVQVTTAVDGITLPGPIEFLDPWFVEPDGSQPDNNWKTYPTGVNPSTHVNGGLFLNQINESSKPHYKAKVTQNNIISGINSVFLNWSGPANTVYSPSALETPIVFRSSTDVVTAHYKAMLGSNSSTWVNSNQWVNDNGSSTVMYKSNNQLWLHTEDGSVQKETLIESDGATVTGYSFAVNGTDRFITIHYSGNVLSINKNDEIFSIFLSPLALSVRYL